MLNKLRKGASQLLGKPLHVGQMCLKLSRVIGEGGFGFVYEAMCDDKHYAVKKLICQTQEQLTSAKQEAEMMRALSFCPACVPMVESCEKKEGGATVLYVVMPLYSCSVHDLLQRGKLPEPFLLGVISRVTEALHAVHSLGYIHLDIKPTNFFISLPYGASPSSVSLTESVGMTCVLGDYGSCTKLCVPPGQLRSQASLRMRLQNELQRKTTPNFRAPEIIDLYSGLAIAGVTDAFSLGISIYQCAYNLLAFESDGAAANCKYKIPFEFEEIYNTTGRSPGCVEKNGVRVSIGSNDPCVLESDIKAKGIPFDSRHGPAYSPLIEKIIRRLLIRNNIKNGSECRAGLVEIADMLRASNIPCNLNNSLDVDEFGDRNANALTPGNSVASTPHTQPTSPKSVSAVNIFDALGESRPQHNRVSSQAISNDDWVYDLKVMANQQLSNQSTKRKEEVENTPALIGSGTSSTQPVAYHQSYSQQDLFSQFEFASADSVTTKNAPVDILADQPATIINIFDLPKKKTVVESSNSESDFLASKQGNGFESLTQKQFSEANPSSQQNKHEDNNYDPKQDVMTGNVIDFDFSITGVSTAEPTEDIIQNLERNKHNKMNQIQSESESLDSHAKGLQEEQKPTVGLASDDNYKSDASSLSVAPPAITTKADIVNIVETTLTEKPGNVCFTTFAPFLFTEQANNVIHQLLASAKKHKGAIVPQTLHLALALLIHKHTPPETIEEVDNFLKPLRPTPANKELELLKGYVQILVLIRDETATGLKILGQAGRFIKSIVDTLFAQTQLIQMNDRNIAELHVVNILFDVCKHTQEHASDQHLLFSAESRLDVEYTRFRTVVSRMDGSGTAVTERLRIPPLPVMRMEKPESK